MNFKNIFLISFLLTACDAQQNKNAEKTQTSSKKLETSQITIPQHPDQDCDELSQEIKLINEKSTIEALKNTNQKIKKCIPSLSSEQRYTLIEQTGEMYGRFLMTKSGNESLEGLNAYGYAKFYPEYAPESALTLKKKLTKRDQYLIDQIDTEYIQFLDTGEGYFDLRLHPQYFIDYFVPHLPKDEAIFIEKMANDNKDILYSDSSIAISGKELAERAYFWENYIKTFPNSNFIKEAKYLLNEYKKLIFIGLDNSPAFSFQDHHFKIEEETNKATYWLMDQKDTQLTLAAQFYHEMLAESYPELSDLSEAYEFVQKRMGIEEKFRKEYDCHSGVLCFPTP